MFIRIQIDEIKYGIICFIPVLNCILFAIKSESSNEMYG